MRLLALAVSVLVFTASATEARDAREQARIDYLINSLGNLSGAVFIRNGTEYKASEAQQHLRRKLAYAGERLKTAEQFIKYCASESSFSHQPYRIRFANGETVETAAFFEQQLKNYKP